MYSTEIPFGIHQIIALFHKMGMEHKDGINSRKVGKTFYVIYFISFTISAAAGAISNDDEDDSKFLMVLTIGLTVIAAKLTYILLKNEEMSALVRDVGTHSFTDHGEYIDTNKTLKNLEKFINCYILMMFCSYLVYAISCFPAFYSENSKRRLPINIGFVFNWKESEIVYWVAFAYVATGLTLGYISMFLTFLIWYLMINYCIKYRLLENKFKNLGHTKSVKKTKISDVDTQKIFLQNLIELNKNHRNIEKSVDQFKECFSILFFIQITTSCLSVCGSVYVLAFSSFTNVFCINYVVLLLYSIFEIFTLTYLGNEIKSSSDRLSYSLFQSNWIDQSKSCKKNIIILTEILKQPKQLIIGKLYPLNLETFTTIINLAYKLFNILKQAA